MHELDQQFFCYKGKPLVRSGNILYYGSMLDPYVVMLQVKSTHEEHGIPMADKVDVKLMKTDKNINPMEAIAKSAEKKSLYQAMDIADIWLTRALAE